MGVWNSNSYAPAISIRIDVKKDNNCDIHYEVLDASSGKKKNGIVQGTVYYCHKAGMGTVVPHDLQKHPALAEIIGDEACGVFKMDDEESVTVSFMSFNFQFIKE